MNASSGITLTLARAGMEISWRYAWALYLLQLAGGRELPLPGAVCAFLMAATLTQLTAGRNWRLYQRLLLQIVGFIPPALLVVHPVQYPALPLFSLNWIGHLLLDAKSIHQWFILLLTICCLLIIWQGGHILVKSSRRYYPVCMRFDKGLGLFFLLLIAIAFIESRVGFHLPGRDFVYLAVSYLIFSLTAISIARNESNVQKSFLAGHYGIGIILSTSILITLLSIGTILFFYPYLSSVSDSLSNILKDVARPMDAVMMNTLLFLIRLKERSLLPAQLPVDVPEFTDMDNTPKVTDMDTLSVEGGGGLFQLIVGWGIFGIIGMVFLGVLVCLFIYIFQLLLKRTRDDTIQSLPAGWISDFLRRLIELPMLLWDRVVSLLKGSDCAAIVYAGMLRWGRSSGIILKPSETPSEYGTRLIKGFPCLMVEIREVVDAFNREIYGKKTTDQEALSRLRSALRRMKRLRYWPIRIKMWFFQ